MDPLLTAQEAAEILNVPVAFLMRLLDESAIPATQQGPDRRFALPDVLAYKARRDRERLAALDGITRLSEACGEYESAT